MIDPWRFLGALSAVVLLGLLVWAKAAQAEEPVYLPLVQVANVAANPTATATSLPTPSPTGAPPTATPERTPVVPDIYVDDDNITGTEAGTAQFPYKGLQAAINAANDGDTIVVAAGTYREQLQIQAKTLQLYGGYVGATAADYGAGSGGNFSERNAVTNITHLQGDGTDSVVTLIEAGSSRVDGFQITGGTRSLVPEFSIAGGGLYVSGGAPLITNNRIEHNDTRPPTPTDGEPVGGGIYATGAEITISNNTIRNNIAGRGAGIAIDGGNVTIRDNVIQGNVGVSDHGGGLYIAAPQVEITHNLIQGNEIGRALGYGWGGGLIVFGAGSNAHLAFNTITENYAPSVGSGVFIDDGATAILEHELIYHNACPDGGTTGGVGIYVDGYDTIGSQVTLRHVTVASHPCPTMGGNGLYVEAQSQVTIQNSIFWDNGGDDFFVDATSQLTATYTLAEETIVGLGNLAVDPHFADPAQHDYHLQSTGGRWDPKANGGNGDWLIDAQHSPAIDAADPASAYHNEPAPHGNRANLGVYGNTLEASKSRP